jgi:ethanolamine utilization protein
MKVSEMEELIQKITNRVCQQLPMPTCSLAFTQEKKDIPAELYTHFPNICWQTKEDQNTAGMIVPQLTISQMSSIALLQETDTLTRRILSFLFQGKPVLVLAVIPVVSKKNQLKFRLKQVVQQHMDNCQQFGVKFYRSPKDYADFWKECQLSVPKSKTISKRTYITEKKLKQMLENRIPLAKDAQLTPLAQDYARKYQVRM